MSISHPVFDALRVDDSQVIWRYLDFTKFLSLLDKTSLYFTRSDMFEDPYEGEVPASMRQAILEFARQNINNKSPEDWLADFIQGMRNIKKVMYINCWHMNSDESAAMWRLYVSGKEGLAIKSTVGDLRRSMSGAPADVYFARVNYVDYRTCRWPMDNAYWHFVHKRKEFEHEREYRALMMWMRPGTEPKSFTSPTEHGVEVPVDPNILVNSIHVSPEAPQWFVELVGSVVNRYGLGGKPIEKSRLYTLEG